MKFMAVPNVSPLLYISEMCSSCPGTNSRLSGDEELLNERFTSDLFQFWEIRDMFRVFTASDVAHEEKLQKYVLHIATSTNILWEECASRSSKIFYDHKILKDILRSQGARRYSGNHQSGNLFRKYKFVHNENKIETFLAPRIVQTSYILLTSLLCD